MSTIELHIWSHAFDLPSLDAESLSAIAYLTASIPRDLWVIVESNNATLSPTGALPALKDGKEWIGGFDNIVTYINNKSNGQSNIDRSLNAKQLAESLAFKSLIHQLVSPVIALSLYITPKNYINVTRPLYSTFLPFPTQYQIPIQHHRNAITLTSHLDSVINEITAEPSSSQSFTTTFAGITTFNKKPKDENKEKITTRLKLRRLLSDFLNPIQEKISGRKYFFGGKGVTSIDCVLLGYISLLLSPELPSPWSKEVIQEEYPDIVTYINGLKNELFPTDLNVIQPSAEDKLSISLFAKNNIESLLTYWDDGIPKDHEGHELDKWRLWNIAKIIGGVGVAVGAVFTYIQLTQDNVDVSVAEGLSEEVFVAQPMDSDNRTDVESELAAENQQIPLFRAEDMLGLRI